MEKICGVVEDALTKNNWAKLILSSTNFPSHIKGNAVVIGTCFSGPSKGQALEIEGDWDNHEIWGWQFKASKSQVVEKTKTTAGPKEEPPNEPEPEPLNNTVVGVIKTMNVTEKGWARITLDADSIPDFVVSDRGRVTVIGTNLSDIAVGRRILARGSWLNHAQYGWQFQAKSTEGKEPKDISEVIMLLTGMKNIGKQTAIKIANTLGVNAIEIIENQPERLLEVNGIGEKSYLKMVNGFLLKKKLLPLKKIFGGHTTDNKLEKLYEQYGEEAVPLVLENPYRICDDVLGIGFKIADGIAKGANIDGNNPFRIRAAITYVLKHEANLNGHLFLKQAELAPLVRELLDSSFRNGEISDMDILNAENAGIDDKQYVRVGSELYLAPFYRAEQGAAKRLRTIAKSKSAEIKDPHKIIRSLESKFNIKYAPKQIEAITAALASQLLVITGGPGTGKTTIIRGIISAYKALYPRHKIDICAPTGRAAKRINETSGFDAQTIHRLIEMRGGKDEDKEGGDKALRVNAGRNEDNPLEADLIVVDESSMIDMLLLNAFLRAVKKGCKLIFVGDADQLPSVGAGNVFADMIKSKLIPTVHLNEIFRQADTSRIIINAHKINHGEYPLDWGPDFEFIKEEDEGMAQKIIGKLVTDIIREANGDMESVQVLSPVRKRTKTGVNELNQYLQTLINPETIMNNRHIKDHATTFRRGDKVIQTKNDTERDVYNGDIGMIESIETGITGALEATINFSGRKLVYTAENFENVDLCYTTTIHKSQGSEFPIVIIPISKSHSFSLQRNLVYTGVTRAKKKVILVGDKQSLVIAMKKNKATNRNTNLLKELEKDLA